jgi:transcriptional regulator with XRE-family HTH domain
MNTIGDRLKQIRLEAGLRQKDIAEKLGIQLSDYIDIEKDKVDLTLQNIKTLKKEFDISIDWLISGIEIKSDIDKFGKYNESIKCMLYGMERNPGLMHGILSIYFERIAKLKSNDNTIPPIVA